MIEQIYNYLLTETKVFSAVVTIVLVGIVLYILTRKGLGALAKRGALAEPLIRLLRLFLRWTFVSVVTLLVLQELGVLQNVWTALLAMAAMVAVGFIAVWSILSNILSTFLILLYRPFRIGDEIRLPADSLQGKVVDLNLMFTTLKDEGEELIQIPNNQFFQKPICRKMTDEKSVSLYEQLTRLTHNLNGKSDPPEDTDIKTDAR